MPFTAELSLQPKIMRFQEFKSGHLIELNSLLNFLTLYPLFHLHVLLGFVWFGFETRSYYVTLLTSVS